MAIQQDKISEMSVITYWGGMEIKEKREKTGIINMHCYVNCVSNWINMLKKQRMA